MYSEPTTGAEAIARYKAFSKRPTPSIVRIKPLALAAPVVVGPPKTKARDWLFVVSENAVTAHSVFDAVSQITQIPKAELRGDCRVKMYYRARQIYFFLARVHTNKSWGQIGVVTNRDHTTALYGAGRVAILFEDHAETIDAVEVLLNVSARHRNMAALTSVDSTIRKIERSRAVRKVKK